VTTLREDLGPDSHGTPAGQSAPRAAAPRPGTRWRHAWTGLRTLARRHWIFCAALAAAAALRVIVMLGFQPAVLFRLDTYDYLWGAVHLSPNVVNPSGYSVFLWLLRPFHSIVLVVALQHVLGLCAAAMVYVVVRRFGLPAYGAVLAAAPVLFDPGQLLIEQFVMADLLALLLLLAGLTVLLLGGRRPAAWRVVAAGLLVGVSVTVRPTTIPAVLLIPAFLLARRAGWRRAGAALLAGALPVLGYMGWFAAVHGQFNLTSSNGLFLWSRTMSFANCAVIRPPADLRALCPDQQPGKLAEPDPSQRRLPKRYLWNHRTWAWRDAPPNPSVPDVAAFTRANNDRAQRFAIAAIEAQPLSYAGLVATESLDPFFKANTLRFPGYQPHTLTLDRAARAYAIGAVKAYTGTDQGVAGYLGYSFGTRLRSPYAFIIQEYQHIVFLPGPVFAAAVLLGLWGLLVPRRRTAAAALLWVSAVAIMVLPTAEHEYTYRYVIPAVPLVCMAAAIALRSPREEPR
jgi:hypothetical protein